jgi:thiamine kinase-like enzyme
MDRRAHQREVRSFLQKKVAACDWRFSLPQGTGMETYFVEGNGRRYFVKLGVDLERYVAMAHIGLSPPVLASGQLDHGVSIIVQPLIAARTPSRVDYREQLTNVAELVGKMHHHPSVQRTLCPAASNSHKDAGAHALRHLRQTWARYRAQVPDVAAFVDDSLDQLALQIDQFSSEGVVASHNDICNANWLFVSGGKIYIVDLDAMAMDDPAFDLGALLWWYYPPELRGQFLEIAGYRYDENLKLRMRVRMALHYLHITLPREGSFDSFHPDDYAHALEDFKAALGGKENPQGYTTG